jgi:hypothetical protein
MQQHVELQVELIDHNQDSDMALLIQIQFNKTRFSILLPLVHFVKWA